MEFIMEGNEIAEILVRLKKLPYELQYSEIEKFPVNILEKLAIKLYKDDLINGIRNIGVFGLLDIILSERVTKIHNHFVWTNENKEKLLKTNEEIMQTFEKAYKKAIFLYNDLNIRINNNDDFIKDYDITILMNFYMGDEYYKDSSENIGFVLSEPLSGVPPIEYYFGRFNSKINLQELPFYLNKEMNWNTEYFNNEFDNEYICYAIHELLDTDKWSFTDIVNIKKIYVDVEVKYKYFRDNEEQR